VSVAESDRYQFVKDLGSGAMGRVSLALDRVSGELVAIKRLHEVVALQGGARLRREFRALERIEHANVLKVLGFGDDRGVPFLIMEYVRGQDLSDWLEAKPKLADIVRVFVGVASALSAVHAQGIVHRDLKPENIRVTATGEAKLMDFGLAKSLQGSVALTKAGAVVGTVLYMAPEQCRGAQLDYRADLYALGAVLYSAVTGRPPFVGDGLAQVVMQHISQAPVTPRQFNPGIPGKLEALILLMLEKNPLDRPQSALAVREALLGILEAPADDLAASSSEMARADALLVAPLIGRDLELGSLLPLLEHPPETGVVAITGDVGSGKTRLLKALSERARGVGIRVAVGEAIEHDPTPFGAVSRLILDVQRNNKGILDALPESARAELARIAPTLGEVPAPDSSLPADVARLRLFEAFTKLLELVCSVTPVVFENLHWADTSTLELLAHATRTAEHSRVIISYRVEDLPEDASVPKGLKPKRTINLQALPDSAMQELLVAWLDSSIDPTLVNELVLHAAGNPWVLEERLKAMLEAGAIFRRGGMYEWNRSLLGLPSGLNELLAHRLAALPTNALEFARAGSVLGRAWMFDDARGLLGWDDDASLDALEALVRAKLVSEIPGSNGEGFRFRHPLYTDILTSSIMSLKRRKMHAKAAALLEGRAAAIELCVHYLEANNFEKALEQGFEAGLLAQNTFAYPQAERAYRLALEASEHLELPNLKVLEVQHQLAEVLSIGGRNNEAIKLWEGVIEHSASLEGGAEVLAQAKVSLVKVLRFTASLEHSLELLGEPVVGTPFFEELCAELAAVYIRTGKWQQARIYAIRALKAARKTGKLEIEALAFRHLAWMESNHNKRFKQVDKLMVLAIARAEKSGNNHVLSLIWVDRGTLYNREQRFDDATRAFEQASKYIQKTANIKLQAAIAVNLAISLENQDEFEEACQTLEPAILLAKRAGYTMIERPATFNLGKYKYALGQFDEGLAIFKQLQEIMNDTAFERSRFFETHIMLERGDGFIMQLPEIKNPEDQDMRHLLEVEHALSFGNYATALELTRQPNLEYAWFWALAKLHATWRLGLEVSAALLEFQNALPPSLKSSLHQTYSKFVNQVFSTDLEGSNGASLKLQAESLFQSLIGIFARDVALSLHD
jgi:tetratricopeptide (TPR) repeat protein/type II secretory pathway predicted ATPase ExeA